MEIAIADQRILVYPEKLTAEEAQETAWEKKLSSFDTLAKLGGFLTRPKDDDFELLYKEHRYEPFWHVKARAKYVYDRNTTYEVPVTGPEVLSVTYRETDYAVTNTNIHFAVVEHCTQEDGEEVLVDGVTGKPTTDLKEYLSYTPSHITGAIEDHVAKDSILVPPQTRVSALMREILAKMIKGIQADKILEETVEVNCIDLYYHPIYAFQYLWKSKKKEAIVEIDALTGAISTGQRTFKEYFGRALDVNFLFDVGADAAGIFIPGGSIAVKIAKKYIDTRKS
jgi:hypothetical protein